jgi:hypothetical protein
MHAAIPQKTSFSTRKPGEVRQNPEVSKNKSQKDKFILESIPTIAKKRKCTTVP